MANETRTDELSELLPSIVAEAMFQAQERSIMRNLVRNYNMSPGTGTTITVPIWADTAAGVLTEGTDMSNTALNTTSATLSVVSRGVMATITDLALKTSASNVIADAGRVMGAAVAKKLDQDLISLFDGFTTEVGSAAAVMTSADIFEALSRLRNAGVSGNDLACVVHPYIAYDIKSSLTSAFDGSRSADLANEAMKSGYVATIAGVDVYESANVPVANESGGVTDYKSAIFTKDALGLAMLDDISIETQRDASMRGSELVCTANYGFGKLNDAWGVEVHSKTSITV
jgi:N4-gp56 family major capsid protein